MANNEDIPKELSASKPIRLFKTDDDEIESLYHEVKHISGLNMQDIIRQCVHAGLPIIKERWKPLFKNKNPND
jgi:hypothetical protein